MPPFEPIAPRLVEGATAEPAFGVVVSLEHAIGRRDALAARAARAGELRLTLMRNEAAFWSLEPVDLPWFPDPICYLGAPRRRIFAPVGRRLALPDLLLKRLLGELERAHGLAPPILALPTADDPSRPRLVGLAAGAPLSAVDWAAVASHAPRRANR
ncbi:MAG: hypothetical protein AAFW46_06800 [Pseudomonadota bacterium]